MTSSGRRAASARKVLVTLGLLFVCSSAIAQDAARPDEDALFGGETAESADGGTETSPEVRGPEAQVQPEGAAASDAALRDQSAFEGGRTKNAFESDDTLDDALRIGALFYQRVQAQHREGLALGDTTLSAPTLVDAYLDGRPTERLRAFVAGRLTFDPTQPTGGATGAAAPGFGFGTRLRDNPSVLLDQAWLRFDVLRTVFVTLGKQHVKWGTARFFNPTDFLTPERRDPLLVFDPRVGASMLKLHLPWEEKGWNFYAIALLDNAGPADRLGQLGGAARAEIVIASTELGVGAVLQPGRAPRYAFDLSSALGPLDVYLELALQKGSERPLYRYVTSPPSVGGIVRFDDLIQPYRADGLNPMGTLGLTWTLAYSDTDTLTFGAEYFYNSLGANAVQLYPFLLVNGLFVPFYTGRHYAAAYAVLFGPGSWNDTSFVLSNLGNLTDRSFISRLDVSQRVLRDLTVEAFGAAHYGNRGEFRLGGDVPSFTLPSGEVTQAFSIAEPTFQVGIGLRLEI